MAGGVKRPVLVRVGDHLVDPHDVAAIVKVGGHRNLYVLRLKSQPNAPYPMWVKESELSILIAQFDVIEEES